MHIARKMVSDGIISLEEYRAADKIFLEKYRPILGTLFSDMALTSRSVSVIYGEGDTNAKDYTYNASRGGSEAKKNEWRLMLVFRWKRTDSTIPCRHRSAIIVRSFKTIPSGFTPAYLRTMAYQARESTSGRTSSA